jgi:MoaA/NifB/PqqE/SkfB family radical SAM enzyme
MSIKNRAYNVLSFILPDKIKTKLFKYICSSIPVAFGVELTNICNAHCSFCAYDLQNRNKGIMNDHVFKKAIDEYSAIGGGSINLTPTVGDPLLDKDIINKIRYAISKDNINNVWFYTNLIALDNFDIDELLTSGLTTLRISTCIKDRETYREIYGVDQYRRVLSNIVKICEKNIRKNSPVKIKLYLKIPEQYEDILNSGDFKLISQYFNQEDLYIKGYRYDSWSGNINESDLPSGQKFRKQNYDIKEEPCYELFRRIHVLYDGTVIFCACRDLNAELKIGNIFEQRVIDIWRGGELSLLRSNWMKGNIPKLCKGCERYYPVSAFYYKQRKNIVRCYLRYLFVR